ncbi:mannose-1-phosphate guanylyltransferase [Xylanimonas allomyrinae]|uniref:Mannose-1-phosphate guanylyltransferase n=1 Tax=Xylanimonas allomyrinae TaxID=2509459 RepID=A0A4P6EPR7_9MICO|nr:mannose-1-phosphate guanylyltransferase [Xylanimonas allomyrinae]QAY63369.1 mannose-1-phosphate guanylyltransferase [Xylanimonas allomyrinae]
MTEQQVPGGPIDDFYAIIPAGGAGTRLWPLSRQGAPKFLHDLTGAGQTLIQQTFARLAPIARGQMLVTGEKHVAACRAQLPQLAEADVLAEPAPRDSMAAIGLAAAVLQRRHGDVVVGSFAADQVINGKAAFEGTVREAVAAAREGYVVTIGIAASRPSVAFGYVQSGGPLGVAGAPSALHALGFTEKPDATTAREYVSSGDYRWNAGIFVVRTSVLLGHLAQQRPALHAGLTEIAAAWDTGARDEVMARVWPSLEKIAIDHAIAEPVAAAGGVAVVPGIFAWDDIGDFNSLAALLPSVDDSGNKVVGDGSDVVRIEVGGTVVVPGTGRVITLLGVDDLVVVDTPDALLVTTRARAQQVKSVVDAVREAGLDELL